MYRIWRTIAGAAVMMALHACVVVPVPVSTDPFHPRAARPVAAELPAPSGYGAYSVPAFDATGERLAVFDSAAREIQLRGTNDLSLLASVKPDRWPRRLSFSPSGRFLVAATHAGWVDAHLRSTEPAAPGADPASRAASAPADPTDEYRENIQRAEVWEIASGRRVAEIACDAVETAEPMRGWLWARNKAIVPGYRNSALLAVHFPADESTLEALCWTGSIQRWDATTWARMPDLPPPDAWLAHMRYTAAALLASNGSAAAADDGLSTLVRALTPGPTISTAYVWSRSGSAPQRWPGDCAVKDLPVQALSANGQWAAALCSAGLGQAVRVWDRDLGREFALEGANFGLTKGDPVIRSAGVALSPDARYLAVIVLEATRALLFTPLPGVVGALGRSDLRLWRLADGREVASVPVDTLVGQANYFRGIDLAISSANDRLAVAGRGLRIYRLADLAAPQP